MIRKIEVIRVFVTPAELRRMADDLQKKFDAAKVGDDVPFVLMSDYSEKLEVRFVADQEEMQRTRRQ